MPRNTTPDPHPLIDLLSAPDSNDAEDAMSLIAYVGRRGPNGELRLFADREAQRFLDIEEADFIHAEEIPEDEHGRMRIYVKRSAMVEEAFDSDAEAALESAIVGPKMSVWQFLPENRIIAAGMLGMLPAESEESYETEEEAAS